QETLLRVYKGIGGFERRSSFARWLFEIALHVYYNELRRAGAAMREGHELPLQEEQPGADEQAAMASPPLVAVEPSPYDETVQHQRQAALRAAMAALPPQMRNCIFLQHQGFKLREIAELMAISTETVKAHLHQARSRLRRALAEEVAGEQAAR